MIEHEEIIYKAAPTIRRFHKSSKFVRGLIGPIGSGKSVGCCVEIFRKACTQEPFNNIRYSRWVVVRNTYRELVDTTMETWFDWFPKHLGLWREKDLKHTLKFPLDDDTQVHLEVIFRALDRPDDVKKLLSLELTGGWINEAREVPKPILDMLMGRVGRYPSKRKGGASWYGVIMDTNPPDDESWWYLVFEEQKPSKWEIFHQPSALSENAENIENLPLDYYENLMSGKDDDWIKVYVHGEYGYIKSGKSMFPEYFDFVHLAQEELRPLKDVPIIIGIDFGLTPAAVICQETPTGRFIVYDELIGVDIGAVRFSKKLKKKLLTEYPGFSFVLYGDPAGEQRSQVDERTPFEVFEANGLNIIAAPTNDITYRREGVAQYLTTLDSMGHSAFLIDRRAKTLRKALAGAYELKRLNTPGRPKYQEKPDKNDFSHVADALQYAVIGRNGHSIVLGNIDDDPLPYNVVGIHR